jgi:hypothetical protein
MKTAYCAWKLAAAALVLVALAGYACAQDAEVTIKGALQCNGICVPDPGVQDHAWVIVAVDGSPEIAD